MPKELFEINRFDVGTVCNPSQTDIPSEAASDSLNIDPIAEDGKLKGIPINTKIEDNVGHDTNVILSNVTDISKHDLISYKNADNKVYKAEDVYSGSSTESALKTLSNATDGDISMEVMEGAVYLGQGTADNAPPQWIGRIDHGQFQGDAPNTLVMEEDTLYPPNMFNETTTACSDGVFVYSCNSGLHGSYNRNYYGGYKSNHHAVGEITKIRISDGKVMARSESALGYINAICMSWDETQIYALTSEKWIVGRNDGSTTTNTHKIYSLNANDLKVIEAFETNLDVKIREGNTGEVNATEFDWDATTAASEHWEDEHSLWEGAVKYHYQGTFSDIMILAGRMWVCTTTGAVFNVATSNDHETGQFESPLNFEDRTPLGLGYFIDCPTQTARYMPPGGLSDTTGGWYKNDKSEWEFPAVFNASLVQLTGSTSYCGVFFKNGTTGAMKFDKGGSDEQVEGHHMIAMLNKDVTAGVPIGGDSNRRLYFINDSVEAGTREVSNSMFKCPKNVYECAYSFLKTWGASAMEVNIREFPAPAYNLAHGSDITTTEVEGNDTFQLPIRISSTQILGMVNDAYLSLSDGNSEASLDVRNKWRQMSKWTDDSGWSHANFGPPLYLSQRCYEKAMVMHSEEDSPVHVTNTGYFYRYSFIYDGFQESPLGANMNLYSTGKKVDLSFCFTTDNLPQRVTGLRIYRAQSASAADRSLAGFYHFVGEVDMTTQITETINAGSYPASHLSDSEHEDGEIQNSVSRNFTLVDHGSAGASFDTLSGLFEGMTDSNVQYSLSTQLNSSLFMANCKHHSQTNAKNIIYKSIPFKPSLVNWALDYLKLPDIPTAIKAFNGRLYAFTESKTIKIEPNTFYIEDIFEGSGCLGPESVFVSDYGMGYCDNYNIYFTNGGPPQAVGDTILTSDAGIGYLDLLNTSTYTPRMSFDARTKSFVLFITTTKAWAYNISKQSWNLWEYDASNKAKSVFVGKKGEILAALNDNHLYDMFSNDTRKAWTWVSKRLSMQHKTQNKKWYEQIVSYEGDAPTITTYWDYSSSPTDTSAGTSETNIVRRNLGNSVNSIKKRLVKTKIVGAANTEVDNIGFTFRRFAKLIDQG